MGSRKRLQFLCHVPCYPSAAQRLARWPGSAAWREEQGKSSDRFPRFAVGRGHSCVNIALHRGPELTCEAHFTILSFFVAESSESLLHQQRMSCKKKAKKKKKKKKKSTCVDTTA